MLTKLIQKVIGSRNDRQMKKLVHIVKQVNAIEPELAKLNDEEIKAKTTEFRQRIEKGESIDALIPEAFAVVRIAAQRTLGMRHYDVQLIGGMVLHNGKISEMQTGEGKTLVATLPAYLNTLSGHSVHIITVNDYLAKRDAEWMGPIYRFLGLSVGVIVAGLEPEDRKNAYASDIVYGTNNEFGFDYLRDNMAFSLEDKVQRKLHYAIVDEVDSILIDEARTPLIISGSAEDSSELYRKIDKLIPSLKRQVTDVEGEAPDDEADGDYSVDEKSKQVFLTEQGNERIEDLLVSAGLLAEEDSLYSSSNIALLHHINAALRAHTLFVKDVDYIVRDGQVIIIDEHTGRMMPGRRWSDGLHQAVEAKEGANIQNESHTLASITFQNYFRLYSKLAGMTGTADTEAFEFQSIYGLEVLIIPTNRPNVRKDGSDLVYMNAEDKFKAIVDDILECQKAKRPALVGTTSIEASEHLSQLLKKENIEHQVLNAKQHQKEALIVAQAGKPGMVTIATNMAGRGTDIVLGGNLEAELAQHPDITEEEREKLTQEWQVRHDQVVAAGGLHIVGTERHESRRIDNQLRGRAARQGDPGSSQFYLSLDDNLIRIFASERMRTWMQKIGLEEGEAIEHPWLSRAIENAQKKVEGRNFDIRKQLLEFDDVANDQRKVIYAQREDLMAEHDLSETIDEVKHDVVEKMIHTYIPPQSMPELWNVEGLEKHLKQDFDLELTINQWLEEDDELDEDQLKQRIEKHISAAYQEKEEQVGSDILRHFEKAVLLQTLDKQWRDHLVSMDYLRQGVHLRGYAQKNPMQEYKREAFELFTGMLENIKYEVATILAKVQVQDREDVDAIEEQRRKEAEMKKDFEHQQFQSETSNNSPRAQAPQPEKANPFVRQHPKIGRNDPCFCGSGKKYKQCCGRVKVNS